MSECNTILGKVCDRVTQKKFGSSFLASEFVGEFLRDFPDTRKNTIVNALSILKSKGIISQDPNASMPRPFYVGIPPKKFEELPSIESKRGAYRK